MLIIVSKRLGYTTSNMKTQKYLEKIIPRIYVPWICEDISMKILYLKI